MDVDKLKVLSGEPIKLNGITLYQPTLRQIKEFGEDNFYSTFWMLCSSAWDMPSLFDDIGVDFMTVSDWQFFMQIALQTNKEKTELIFGDLDFSEFIPMTRNNTETETEDIVLYRPDKEMPDGTIREAFVIDEAMYKEVIKYLREMIGFQHKGRKAKNKATAKILIMDDRKQRDRNKGKPSESALFSQIISLVNTEEFSYTYETVFDITLYQLTKSFIQIQSKKQSCALLQGSMSGFVDTSKIPSKDFSWIYSEEKFNTKRASGQTLKNSLEPGGKDLNIKPKGEK